MIIQALQQTGGHIGFPSFTAHPARRLLNAVVRHPMAIVPDAVPEAALDYDEILRRGGENCGDEDFALCKCPHCGRVYLVEYEVDTLYLDPADLGRRIGIDLGVSGIRCEACGGEFPARTAWVGPKAPELMQVTWRELAASPWRWVAARTRGGDAEPGAAADGPRL